MKSNRARRVATALTTAALVLGGGFVVAGPALAVPCHDGWSSGTECDGGGGGGWFDYYWEDVWDEPVDGGDLGGVTITAEPDPIPTAEPPAPDKPIDLGDLGDLGEVTVTAEPDPVPTPEQRSKERAEKALKEFKEAFDTARGRFYNADKKCLSLITGKNPPDGLNAREVMDKVFERRKMDDASWLTGPKDPATGGEAFAQSPQGLGGRGFIQFYKRWHDEVPPRTTFDNADGDKPLTPLEGRMLVLFHELGHLMGTTPGEHPGNIKEVHQLNAKILRDCVRNP
ncbi:hypothetical protein [Nonomuraea endophytica]|uniref:hypothetical protein n=1 Tax=Nonomuraea endophytica TaxID=714136 RepID=UPI0037C7C899